jgi:hypothetical protein
MLMTQPPAAIIPGDKKVITANSNSVLLDNMPKSSKLLIDFYGDLSTTSTFDNSFFLELKINGQSSGYKTIYDGYQGQFLAYTALGSASIKLARISLADGVNHIANGSVRIYEHGSKAAINAQVALPERDNKDYLSIMSAAGSHPDVGQNGINTLEFLLSDSAAFFVSGFKFDIYSVI